MSKIFLLNPPISAKERSGALASAIGRSLPYGLISLAAVLRKSGYEIDFFDAAVQGYGIEETVERILSHAPDYLGISTVTISVDRSGKIAQRVRARNPKIKILVGGAHMSSTPEETMKRFPDFDVGVIGEGEYSVLELLKALENGGPLGEIPGIIYRESGKLVTTVKRPPIMNLDALPMPAWDLIPDFSHVYRASASSYLRLPSTTLVTSRGCSARCIFCNSRMLFGDFRSFSADYVLEQIRHLKGKYHINDISIYDDNFLISRDRVAKICEAILREKINIT